MPPLEVLIAVLAALCTLSVSALSSYMDRCKDQRRGYEYYHTEDPLDIYLFCGRQPHGIDPLIWLGGNRSNFLHIDCLKKAEDYTCEDIPEFDFGHNDTIKELRFENCPMTFVSIACMERRLGLREALKLTLITPLDGFQWLREDLERLQAWRWISYDGQGEEVTITGDALAPLSALERLELAHVRLRLAPGALSVLRALTHLELKHTDLWDHDLLSPEALANLPALTHLSLSSNRLHIGAYDTFQNLTSLENLDVSNNEIYSLDGAVLAAAIPRLRELNARGNHLVELRPLEKLQHLEKLDISNCMMAEPHLELFPRALGALQQLAQVDISSCRVRTLPADLLIGSKSLLTLNLRNNLLSALPASLFSDQYMLQNLDLSYNKLETLPQEIFSKLKGLKQLYLSSNDLTALPTSLLTNQRMLTNLDLSFNKFETLHQEIISGLVELQRLNLESNGLRTLPSSLFTDQRELQKLDLSNNGLETLPQELFSGLAGLQWLELDYNQLRMLPASLFTDQHLLQKLDLSNNKLETLPQELFSGLAGLQCLKLFHNKLRALPANLFTNQRKLQELNICNNELETLPQELFSGLAELQRLKICHNHLRLLPESLFTNKSMLRNLELSNNELETLPQEFSSLVGLQRLDFSNNHLRALPASLFTDQRMLQVLDFSGNKLETLPQEFSSSLLVLQHLNLVNNLLKDQPDMEGKAWNTAKAWHSLPASVFPDSYNLGIFKTRVNRHYLSLRATSSAASALTISHFLEGLSGAVVDLRHNPLRCDCHLYDLALRMRRPAGDDTVPSLVYADCADPPSLRGCSLIGVDPQDLTCEIPAQFCAPFCRCFKYGPSLPVTMDCMTMFDPLPQQFSKLPLELKLRYAPPSLSWIPSNVQTLDLSDLKITEVPSGLNLSAIKNLDLSGNGLTRVPVELLAANVTVKLAKNPLDCLACDCWHAEGIRQLQAASAFVKDYEELACRDGLSVRQVDVQSLCPQLALCDWWGVGC